jgi:hypothetical protein
MNRIAILIPVLLATGGTQQPSDGATLDTTHAFYVPGFATGKTVAETSLGPIGGATYLRYLAARLGTRHVEGLAFDWLLAQACQARRIGRTAPLLARGMATRRLHSSGRRDADADTRRKFTNEALRELRVQAIVRADRKIDDTSLLEYFDERYGKGGVRSHIRHVFLRVTSSRPRNETAERAGQLHAKLVAGTSFDDLLAQSDDTATRRALRDPESQSDAGFVPRYNYERFGAKVAACVRSLKVGEVSTPVESSQGFHLIHLVERRITEFADVAEALRTTLRHRRVSKAETRALRRSLFAKYRFRPNN